MPFSDDQINDINEDFKKREPESMLYKIHTILEPQDILYLTSGGTYSSVLMHKGNEISKELHNKPITALFVNHGLYYPQTLEMIGIFKDWGIDIIERKPLTPIEELLKEYPNYKDSSSEDFRDLVWEAKELPYEQALKELNPLMVITGIMGHETPHREAMLQQNAYLAKRNKEGSCFVLRPLLEWTDNRMEAYATRFSLPLNKVHYDFTKGPEQKLECGIQTTTF